jgi:hypothetical protein
MYWALTASNSNSRVALDRLLLASSWYFLRQLLVPGHPTNIDPSDGTVAVSMPGAAPPGYHPWRLTARGDHSPLSFSRACTWDRLHPLGSAPVAGADDYDMWVQLQHLLLQHLNKNTCNIHPKQPKYLQRTSETLANTKKQLENMCVAITNMQHPNKIIATYVWNI